MRTTKDGRKYWTKKEAEFLSDPKNLTTKELHKEAHDLAVTQNLNYVIECILCGTDPVTGEKYNNKTEGV